MDLEGDLRTEKEGTYILSISVRMLDNESSRGSSALLT